ncbi:hypothetical protein ACODYM_28960 [Burkholderia gladioli]|uniref:hypothetical protein n=1 Tax=Burkholderia gladioli TaxID=28095 RepID=UPI003B509A12
MTADEMIAYTDTLPLEYALWWFIENVAADAAGRTELFFHLRERMHKEAPINPNARRNAAT